MTIEYGPETGANLASDQGDTAHKPATAAPRRGGYLSVLARGIGLRCPRCGGVGLFRSYLKAADVCDGCGERLSAIRTDDFPPYLTMFIVGHVVVPLVLVAERVFAPPPWQHMLIWPALALALVLALLPPVKGACMATLWYLRLKGDEFQ